MMANMWTAIEEAGGTGELDVWSGKALLPNMNRGQIRERIVMHM